MLVLCPKCWNELKSTPVTCPNCGTKIDIYSRDYERQLIAAISRSVAERRAQICWVLGARGKRSSVPALIELLHDPDLLVRVAALRALAEIGDGSAVNAVEKATMSEQLAIRTVARQVLNVLLSVAPASAEHSRAK